MEMKAFYLQSFASKPLTKLVKIKSADMVADGLTKVMSMPESHCKLLGLKAERE